MNFFISFAFFQGEENISISILIYKNLKQSALKIDFNSQRNIYVRNANVLFENLLRLERKLKIPIFISVV